MPTNVTPEYKKAEAAYKRARDPGERLELLREMLSAIPKHKGTEHLQADIKTKIKELTVELAGPAKTGARTGPPTSIRPEGAAQVALIGPPNSGKSTLHHVLTGSHSPTGPYPFTTQYPQPGMAPYHDVLIQLVDVPAISPEHPIPWIGNTLQTADAFLLVVDLADAGCLAAAVALHEILGGRKVVPVPWGADSTRGHDDDDPFTIHVSTALLVAKVELLDDPVAEIEAFRELTGYEYPALTVSAETGYGLEELVAWLFDHLGIVRVYTKIPGGEPDMSRPFTVRTGQTVQDVAELVHRDIAAGLKYARIWGAATFDGQQVGRDHVVVDGDVVELHT